jgi:hypothetical protein
MRSVFICSSHTWEERFETCRLVVGAGMELCCGALLGMGESDEQRLELLGQLRSVAPEEIPINFLDPRPGTPLGARDPMEPLEAIRWIALFRLALPRVILLYAGGREVTLRQFAGVGDDGGDQRPHRRQLSDDLGPRSERGPRDAQRPQDADRCLVESVIERCPVVGLRTCLPRRTG